MSRNVSTRLVWVLVTAGLALAAAGGAYLLRPPARPVDWTNVTPVAATAKLVWEVLLPWNEHGLGGGTKYQGMTEHGAPIAGGATAPETVVVGTGRIIAVEDRDHTRVFDPSGEELFVVPGEPLTVLPGGMVIVVDGGKVNAYTIRGALAWESETFAEERAALLAEGRLTGGYISHQASPFGYVFCHALFQVPEAPPLEFKALLDEHGNLLSRSPLLPDSILFTPRKTLLGQPVHEAGGFAYAELKLDGETPIPVGTVRVPYSIVGIGSDDTLICRVGYDPLRLIAFRAHTRSAYQFELRADHELAGVLPDGYVFAYRAEPEGLKIVGWHWPIRAGR